MGMRAAIFTRLLPIVLTSDHDLGDDPCDGFYVGTGGTVKVVDRNGNTVPIPNAQDGSYHPTGVAIFKSTDNGTTASNIVAGWF